MRLDPVDWFFVRQVGGERQDEERCFWDSLLSDGSFKWDTIGAEIDYIGLLDSQTRTACARIPLGSLFRATAKRSVIDFPIFVSGPLAKVMGIAME
jgi:hypothetical protein